MDSVFPCLDRGHRGLPLEPGLDMGQIGKRLVARELPGSWKRQQRPLSHELTHFGRGHRGWVQCKMADPWLLKLALGMWNVTSLVGMEPSW